MNSISLILFEDNDRLRESLVYLFNNTDGFTVLADYNDCNDAASAIRVHKPDVVLMDIDMPGQGGIKGVTMVKETQPLTSVIMYTVFEDDDKLFQCLCAGANGYLLKKTPPGKLFEAIQEVMEGGAPMSPSIARKVMNSFKHGKPTQYNLTPRELEVIHLLIKGYSSKMIAGELNISFDTARSHLKNIYIKLHVNCGKQAISKVLIEHIL
ncbi:MAG: response regulator transcription factor [Candidatus Pedobacter colombiensis]|uniref:Response regulator transcription factor n=1 Tax=Candidatus Pedobacter colombiensis TaxID=3121371 RepID=A0AAJ6B5I4_9SPHI|nr:response regulator transcription factor [Pedobacter sp.]WEK17824.1 MAG: response regulator transcription factor [Pedobacter sp.]